MCIRDRATIEGCHHNTFMYRVKGTDGKFQDTNDSSVDVKIEQRSDFKGYPEAVSYTHLIYNDLISRGYSVDVGIVELTRIIEGLRRSSQYKIDFVVNVGNDKLYIPVSYTHLVAVENIARRHQSAFAINSTEQIQLTAVGNRTSLYSLV